MSSAVLQLAGGTVPAASLAAWASLPALYHRWAMSAGGETYLLGLRGGRIVGYAALRGTELTAAFVHPRWAGRGLGRALVGALLARARRRGLRRIHGAAAPGALPFYLSLGFRPGRAVRVPLPGGLALRAIRVAVTLPRA